MADRTRHFTVEIDHAGCDRCCAGQTWTVVAGGEVALGESWDNVQDAIDMADLLNEAYEAGKLAAQTEVK